MKQEVRPSFAAWLVGAAFYIGTLHLAMSPQYGRANVLDVVLPPLLIVGFLVLPVVGLAGVFRKAGQAPWKAIIPVYNFVVLCRILSLSPFLIIGLCFIPFVGAVISNVIISLSLADAFGKDKGFKVGLFLMPAVGWLIIAFDRSAYQYGGQQKPQNTESDASMREWRSPKDGSTFRARYSYSSGEFVFLRRDDGKVVKMSTARLLPEDREYISSLKTGVPGNG